MNSRFKHFLFFSFIFFIKPSYGQELFKYEVDLSAGHQHVYRIAVSFCPQNSGVLDLRIPEWTPGYYQLLNFSEKVKNVEAHKSSNREMVEVSRIQRDTWRIPIEKEVELVVTYEVLADELFIAEPFIEAHWAFLRPTGVFLYPDNSSKFKAEITFVNYEDKKIVTGLDKKGDKFIANSRDEMYDSPFLIGELEELPTFEVKGIPHYFYGRDLRIGDKEEWVFKLKKMIESATDLMDDLPYSQYVFMAIGEGRGGIEQTNSTAFSMDYEGYDSPEGKERMLNFLTHEYFHHFNIKRIRPLELGPFDYSQENRTQMLWIAEGLTVYFEDIILNRAQLKTRSQMLSDWTRMIRGYESNPGKKKQSLAESSYQTWEDGPFGIKGETISPYEKGPIIGMLLDLKIREQSKNKHSLIDVMRYLYTEFYQNKQRGFTEQEFKEVCEKFAGVELDEIFNYIYNTEPINYNRFFEPAGLKLVSSSDKDYRVIIQKELNPLQEKITKDLFRE